MPAEHAQLRGSTQSAARAGANPPGRGALGCTAPYPVISVVGLTLPLLPQKIVTCITPLFISWAPTHPCPPWS